MATRRRASKNSLTGSITDLQRRVRYLQAKPVPSRLANQVVTRSAIQPRAVSTDQIALAAITNDQVAADAIKQEQIDNKAVGTAQLQDASVQTLQIQDDAVTQDKLAAGSVGNSQLQDNSVGNGQLQENSVNTNEIASGAVGTDQLAGEAVTTDKIRGGAVTRAKIDGLAVGAGELDNGAVTTDKIQDDQITKLKMKESSVGAREIINGSITAAQLSSTPRAVTAEKIADSAVITNRIANLAVTTAKIADDAVTGAKIATQTIGVSKLTSGSFGPIVGNGLEAGGGLAQSTQPGGKQFVYVLFGNTPGRVPFGNHTHTVSNVSAGTGTRTTSVPNSTLRVKKNIKPYKPEKIKDLLKLEPKTYQYKRSKRESQEVWNKDIMHGYIVEELLELGFPEPVGYDEEGLPATLDYSLISMLVLELVKVQQTEIDSLKEEVLRLKDAK